MSHTLRKLSSSHANKGLRGESNSIGGKEQQLVEHLEHMQGSEYKVSLAWGFNTKKIDSVYTERLVRLTAVRSNKPKGIGKSIAVCRSLCVNLGRTQILA